MKWMMGGVGLLPEIIRTAGKVKNTAGRQTNTEHGSGTQLSMKSRRRRRRRRSEGWLGTKRRHFKTKHIPEARRFGRSGPPVRSVEDTALTPITP